jgi:tyrosyl-tRNA synthetase
LRRDPGARTAQRALAEEATRLLHGEDGLQAAQRATRVLFGDEPFDDLDDRTLADAFDTAPTVEIPLAQIGSGLSIVDLLARVGAAGSKGEARRLIAQGGVSVNNRRVADPDLIVGLGTLAGARTAVLRVGKKRYFLARFV